MGKEFLKAMLKATSEGIIITDDSLRVVEYNDVALGALGVTRNELKNKNIKEFITNIDLINKCIKSRKVYKSEECIFTINENRIRCITNIVPVENEEKVIGIIITFRDTRHIHRVVNNVVGYSATFTFEDIITKNQNMKKIIRCAKKAANTDCNILLEGSSGTGKEVFAQAIHNYSKRARGPFVAVNCAAIPRDLVESELFGYEKGAFTGANKGGYPGKFELAEGGTIFLDEIGELPLDIQAKLLRVLDNHKIVRVGSTYEKKVNVRVIAATNRNLIDEVEKRNFRYDLYYRLNVIGIKLMDLKDRKEDIEPLIKYFIYKLNNQNMKNKEIEKNVIEELKEYKWLGNVRELRNLVEKAYYLCDDIITKDFINNLLSHKPRFMEKIKSNDNEVALSKDDIMPLKLIEEQSIRKALICCKGNADEAAKILGISRATIYRRINKYGIKIS